MTRLRLWLRTVLFRGRLDREMREEMQAHLDRAAGRLRARGVEASEARAQAMREFGNVPAIQELARDARGGRGVETLLADCHSALRHFSRTPLAAVTMIVIFALGIGFNTAFFATMRSFTSRTPAGIDAGESTVRIRGIDRSRGAFAVGREFSYPEYREYAAATNVFSAVGAWTSSDAVLQGDSGGEIHSGAVSYVTPDFFPVLDVRPIRGQGLPTDARARDDAEPQLTAIVSYVVWDRVFDRAADVVGRTIRINTVPVTIAGVAPHRFNGVRTGASRMRVWVPLNARSALQPAAKSLLENRESVVLGIVARLAPGVDAQSAMPVVETIAARSAAALDRPRSPGVLTADVAPLLADNYFPPSGESPDSAGRTTTLLIPIIVMLITCTNVSALQAGLGWRRRQEIAVRLSLGASRARIVRQLVTESVVLALAAGTLAAGVIWILLRAFEASIEGIEIAIDGWVLAYTAGVAMLAGVVFGISPALSATRLALSDALKSSGGSLVPRSRLQAAMVVAQIAVTQPALLAMGSLLLEMNAELREIPAPVHGDRLLEVRFNTNPRYGAMTPERESTLARLREKIGSLPDVAGIVAQEPNDDSVRVEIPGTAEDAEFQTKAAPPGYFNITGMQIVRGRDFRAGDEHAAVLIVGTGTARRLFGVADPIGQEVRAFSTDEQKALRLTVVGVVDEASAGFGRGGREPQMFVPGVRSTGHLLVRTRVPADAVTSSIRLTASTDAPDLPVIGVRTLASVAAEGRRSVMRVLGIAVGTGLLALFLSAVGLYAAVAVAVSQRVREIGIRTALGADHRRVVGLFVRRGLKLSFAGLTIGLALSLLAVRLLSLARGTEAEGGIYGLAAIVAVIVVLVAAAAAWIPARRAARVDPLAALRME